MVDTSFLTLLKNKSYKKIMVTHCREILEYLIQKKVTFSIACNITHIKFEPSLPNEIISNFNAITVFVLEGYTFDSIELDSANLYFEAGFGRENFASFVTVPLSCVVQIFIQHKGVQGDFLAFINWTASLEEPKDDGLEQSMQALLSNPNNQHLLHKGVDK